jgi:hypothetical protein
VTWPPKPHPCVLDLTHPLVSGLVFASPLEEGTGLETLELVQNRLTGTSPASFGQSNTAYQEWVTNPYGWGMKFEPSGIPAEGINYGAANIYEAADEVEGTVEVIFKRRSTMGDGDGGLVLRIGGGSGREILIFVSPQTSFTFDWGRYTGDGGVNRIFVDAVGANRFAVDSWNQLVCVKNPTSMRVYLNNSLLAAGAFGSNPDAMSQSWMTGTGTIFLTGDHLEIADVRWWNRALTAPERSDLFADPFAMYRGRITCGNPIARIFGGTAAEGIVAVAPLMIDPVEDVPARQLRFSLDTSALSSDLGGPFLPDPTKLDDLAAPDDNTDLDVSITAHGLTPKLPNDSTKFLNGVGAYAVPPSGGVSSSRAINTTAPLTGGGDLSADRTLAISDFVASGASHARGAVPDPGSTSGATKFLREDGGWSVPVGTGGSLSDSILGPSGGGGARVSGLVSSIEVIPGGGSDDEFDTTDTSDPMTGWTTMGTPTTHDINSTLKSHYYLKLNSAAGEHYTGIYKAWSPSAGSKVTAKLAAALGSADFARAGVLFVSEATPGKIRSIGLLHSGITPQINVDSFTNPTTYLTNTTAVAPNFLSRWDFVLPFYFRIVYNSSTSLDFQASINGIFWVTYVAAMNPAFTIGAVGLAVDNNGGSAEAYFDWIRFS